MYIFSGFGRDIWEALVIWFPSPEQMRKKKKTLRKANGGQERELCWAEYWQQQEMAADG
jgi:hypothetical protein